jgi:hypothetical protein
MSHKKVLSQGYSVRKRMIRVHLTDVCTRNLHQKAERGKKTCAEPSTRFSQASCFEKLMPSVPEIWGRTYNILPWSAKDMRKQDKKSDSRATKKGTKKLAISNFANILE